MTTMDKSKKNKLTIIENLIPIWLTKPIIIKANSFYIISHIYNVYTTHTYYIYMNWLYIQFHKPLYITKLTLGFFQEGSFFFFSF